MMKKNCLAGALIFVLGFLSLAGGQVDEKKIFDAFLEYTGRVYVRQHVDMLWIWANAERLIDSGVLGYSLGNLLPYARRGSENHAIWLMLEKKTKELIFAIIDDEGARKGWNRAAIEDKKQRAWRQCMAAQQGWLDVALSTMTTVHPKDAPDFFETLETSGAEEARPAGGEYTCEIKEYRDSQNPDRGGWILKEDKGKHRIVHVGNSDAELRSLYIRLYGEERWNALGFAQELRDTQGWQNTVKQADKDCQDWRKKNNLSNTAAADKPDPPIKTDAPARTAPRPRDMVGGTYRITGNSYYDNNPGSSLVKLTGSMFEVEAEFRIFGDQSSTWNYKGTARWDGKNSEGKIYDLSGKTQDMRYPDNPQRNIGLGVRIERSDDGIWRAASINIGGNLFKLLQLQGVEREVRKVVTIRNLTPWKIFVHLAESNFETGNLLGTVESNDIKTFEGIPERGRWYIRVNPDINSWPHYFTLYVKEAQYLYAFEVKAEDFR